MLSNLLWLKKLCTFTCYIDDYGGSVGSGDPSRSSNSSSSDRGWSSTLSQISRAEGILSGNLSHAQGVLVGAGKATYSSNYGYELTKPQTSFTGFYDGLYEQAFNWNGYDLNMGLFGGTYNGYGNSFTGGGVGDLSFQSTFDEGFAVDTRTMTIYDGNRRLYSVTNYEFLGMSWSTNQHYTSSGEKLGFIAEGLVDIAETFKLSLDPDIAQGIGSVFGTALSYAMGVRGVALALSAVVSLVDTKLAEKVIGTEAAINLKAIAMVATTLQTMGQLVVSVEAILSSDYLTVGQKAIAATALGAQGYIAMSGFGGFTGTPGSNLNRVFTGFTSSKGDFTGDGYNTIDELWNAYGQWQYETGSSYSLDDVQGDPFEYMAGGETYNAQSAGGPLYLADKARNPREIMDRDLKLSKDDKVRLLQEDGQFVDLQPVNTNTSDSGDVLGVARQGQISQLNRLIKGYTEAIDEYNQNVDKYNARTGTLTRAELTTQMNAIEGLGDSITELRTQFNL